jgi:acetyl esterase/lipase
MTIPSREGDTPVTVYLPESGESAPTVYINFHGGGYIFREPQQDDPWCRYLAANAGVVVLNVDYVVAPQRPFPGAVYQVFDVLQWVAEHGSELGWDTSKISVGGQSAGGGLAATTSILANRAGGPEIALQILHYPPLDLVKDPGDKHIAGSKALLTPGLSRTFNAAYVSHNSQRKDPLASPVYATAEDLDGIAPAVVVTPQFDRLHDEGVVYAKMLDKAGALVEHIDLTGVDHGYNLKSAENDVTRDMYARLAAHVVKAHQAG